MSSGDVLIDDEDVTFEEPSDRGVAMVFQSYALYPHMNVYDNIAFNLRLSRLPKPEIDARVREAARILRIDDLLARSPAQLSGGQRQRVAIGRAIVRNPKVFLFDEPLSNLDAALRVQMRLEIGRLHRELGATMIYVTHDQVEAMTMADRILVLDGGKVQQAGSPAELYSTAQNRFVAGFLGSPRMNFLQATGGRQLREGNRVRHGCRHRRHRFRPRPQPHRGDAGHPRVQAGERERARRRPGRLAGPPDADRQGRDGGAARQRQLRLRQRRRAGVGHRSDDGGGRIRPRRTRSIWPCPSTRSMFSTARERA